MFNAILFCFGTIAGSFLNVVSLRYDPDRFLLGSHVVFGRSMCPHCKKTLEWYELIPLISFFIQGGRCRGCGAKLSIQYPVVEAIAGLLLAYTPSVVRPVYMEIPERFVMLSSLWSLALLTLLLISIIDSRTQLIPDEAVLFLGALGIGIAILSYPAFSLAGGSLLGGYSILFGFRSSLWINRALGILAGGVIFGSLIAITRGRGMGMGDMKLAMALGLLFGWAELLVITALAFILGSVVGGLAIIFRHKHLKSYVPFGPFLALASAAVFFFGEGIMRFYVSLAGL